MKRIPSGVTFYTKKLVPIDDMRQVLLCIARYIQDKEFLCRLNLYDDWWEHDGFHFQKKDIEVSKLFKILSSNRSLYEAMPDDFDVRIGISNKEKSWYLRYYIDWDEDDSFLEGNFHFSVPKELEQDCTKNIFDCCNIEIEKENSDNIWSELIK